MSVNKIRMMTAERMRRERTDLHDLMVSVRYGRSWLTELARSTHSAPNFFLSWCSLRPHPFLCLPLPARLLHVHLHQLSCPASTATRNTAMWVILMHKLLNQGSFTLRRRLSLTTIINHNYGFLRSHLSFSSAYCCRLLSSRNANPCGCVYGRRWGRAVF